MNGISILIPTYNDSCYQLAYDLWLQAGQLSIPFELLVGDDGSTNRSVVAENRRINSLSGCRYIERPENQGRAAVRNFLASEARYDSLVFVDAGRGVVRKDFLAKYVRLMSSESAFFYGGYEMELHSRSNLRSVYEDARAPQHTAQQRSQHPYLDFNTCNFACPTVLFRSYPLDERFRHYGFEDVLYGKRLQTAGILIRHVDNPVALVGFDSNEHFVTKWEEALTTLCQFRNELRGYSRMLSLVDNLKRFHLLPFVRLWHRAFGFMERRQLLGTHPSLFVFELYRLGYFAIKLKETETSVAVGRGRAE
ncbi:MAG: glycosyltransferase family 2 protein [Prevotella sp.]|jgi:glycosyltransferase involved in cell wall biosynthesis